METKLIKLGVHAFNLLFEDIVEMCKRSWKKTLQTVLSNLPSIKEFLKLEEKATSLHIITITVYMAM